MLFARYFSLLEIVGQKQTSNNVMHGGGFWPKLHKTQSTCVEKWPPDLPKEDMSVLSINYRVRENPKDDKAEPMRDALERCYERF